VREIAELAGEAAGAEDEATQRLFLLLLLIGQSQDRRPQSRRLSAQGVVTEPARAVEREVTEVSPSSLRQSSRNPHSYLVMRL